MRCMCRECGAYMVQAEDSKMGCICPECFNRCTDCLGTDTVISKEAFASMKDDPLLASFLLGDRSDGEQQD